MSSIKLGLADQRKTSFRQTGYVYFAVYLRIFYYKEIILVKRYLSRSRLKL